MFGDRIKRSLPGIPLGTIRYPVIKARSSEFILDSFSFSSPTFINHQIILRTLILSALSLILKEFCHYLIFLTVPPYFSKLIIFNIFYF